MTIYRSLLGLTATAAAAAAVLAASPVRAQSVFPDVPDNHWAADSVRKLAQAGIMSGYPKTASAQQKKTGQAYSGNKPVTRYELAVTLYRFVQYMERADRQRGGRGVSARPLPPVASGAEAARRLISAGYLPANTPLAKNGATLVTANQLADALARVISRVTEKRVPITPDSQRAPIQRPDSSLGTE